MSDWLTDLPEQSSNMRSNCMTKVDFVIDSIGSDQSKVKFVSLTCIMMRECLPGDDSQSLNWTIFCLVRCGRTLRIISSAVVAVLTCFTLIAILIFRVCIVLNFINHDLDDTVFNISHIIYCASNIIKIIFIVSMTTFAVCVKYITSSTSLFQNLSLPIISSLDCFVWEPLCLIR